jgi:hypothetical protein
LIIDQILSRTLFKGHSKEATSCLSARGLYIFLVLYFLMRRNYFSSLAKISRNNSKISLVSSGGAETRPAELLTRGPGRFSLRLGSSKPSLGELSLYPIL